MIDSIYCAVCNLERQCQKLFEDYSGYQLYRCSNCDLVFLHPLPENDFVKDLYTDSTSCYLPVDCRKLIVRKFKLKLASLRFQNWNGQRRHNFLKDYLPKLLVAAMEVLSGSKIPYTMGIPALMPKDAAILEIGYGNGSWLLAMRELGYSTLFGIEINSTVQNILLKKQIKAQVGDIQDFNFPDEFFDIIRLEHVFEHLPHPLEQLQKLARWLKPKGQITLTVPNIDSLTFRIFGPETTFLNLPEHIYQYSLQSLNNLAPKCGLQVTKYRTIGVWRQFSTSLLRRRKTLLAKLINHPLAGIIAPLYSLSVWGKGEFLSVILSKIPGPNSSS
jgi:ubiquinone/menaquinone biosynthesis C-methylase UbiE